MSLLFLPKLIIGLIKRLEWVEFMNFNFTLYIIQFIHGLILLNAYRICLNLFLWHVSFFLLPVCICILNIVI